jgi:hypothetical protein
MHLRIPKVEKETPQMKKTCLTVFASLFAITAASLAQGPRGPFNQRSPNHAASVLNMAKVQTVTGTISAVNLAYGMQYPSITVNKSVIKVAPVWYFLDNSFEVKAGDPVSVSAAPSTLPNDSYLYAIEITNTNSAAKIVLRDSSGIPLWMGSAGGRGNPDAARNGSGCVDPATITTAAGTVEKLSLGAGIQMPTLVLKVNGRLISLKIGPEHILLEADFELKEGEQVTVKYAHATCDDEDVALQLANAAGATVVLRNDDGTPNWN